MPVLALFAGAGGSENVAVREDFHGFGQHSGGDPALAVEIIVGKGGPNVGHDLLVGFHALVGIAGVGVADIIRDHNEVFPHLDAPAPFPRHPVLSFAWLWPSCVCAGMY